MAAFNERIKDLRKVKRETQKQIADLLDLTERTYRAYEAGSIDPPSSKVLKLANHFNVSVDYILGQTDRPEKH